MREATQRWTAIGTTVAGLIGLGLALDATGALPLLRLAVQQTPTLNPGASMVPAEELERGLPVVSLYVRPDGLYDPNTGILTHPLEHGREWEREGWISFFEHGQLAYSTSAGVRVHGGGSRSKRFAQAYRLYFRKRYGRSTLPGAVAFGNGYTLPLKRLIVHNDMRLWDYDNSRWHLVNPLAYDIARAIGCITPETRPVRFYLNGKVQGVFVLTEHFDATDYFVAHLGHRVFMDDESLDALWDQVNTITPLRMRTIAPLVDIDNLTRWFIAVVFCATSDAYQGPGQFRDPSRRTAPWFWVAWDLDQSFHFPEHDTFAAMLELDGHRRGRRENEPRARILTTLIRDDPEYREYFKRIWVDVMNHVLTPQFLEERYEHYEALATTLYVRDFDYLPRIKRFFAGRPAILRRHAEQYLGTGRSVRLALSGEGRPVTIDGRRAESGWSGYYFPGMTAHLSVSPDETARFSHWLLNGTVVRATALDLALTENTRVEAVWR